MRKIVLLFLFMAVYSVSMYAQTGKATGVVVDEQGETLIGVVVTVKDNPRPLQN